MSNVVLAQAKSDEFASFDVPLVAWAALVGVLSPRC